MTPTRRLVSVAAVVVVDDSSCVVVPIVLPEGRPVVVTLGHLVRALGVVVEAAPWASVLVAGIVQVVLAVVAGGMPVVVLVAPRLLRGALPRVPKAAVGPAVLVAAKVEGGAAVLGAVRQEVVLVVVADGLLVGALLVVVEAAAGASEFVAVVVEAQRTIVGPVPGVVPAAAAAHDDTVGVLVVVVALGWVGGTVPVAAQAALGNAVVVAVVVQRQVAVAWPIVVDIPVPVVIAGRWP